MVQNEKDKTDSQELIEIATGDLDVWYVHSEAVDSTLLDRWYDQWLSQEERSRCDRFAFEKDRRLCLIARALARYTLSRYRDVPVADWRFGVNSHGKPHVESPEVGRGLQFNLSHSAGLVVCAVAADRPVGIDVESAQDDAPLDVADRYFGPGECTRLRSLVPAEQSAGFYTYWTLKEAYIKARGLGLSLPLDKFEFHIQDRNCPRIEFAADFEDEPSRWQFMVLDDFAPRHALAIATKVRDGRPFRLRLRSADLHV